MIKPGEIQKIAGKCKVKDGQIEKDYILSWILYGISQNKFLFENLIFKGGTTLKKAYYKDYRFSEDLDFTLFDDNISKVGIFREFDKIFEFIREEANISLQRKPETEFETGNINFYILYGGPLGGTLGKKDLKIDLSRFEKILFHVDANNIFRDYSDLKKPFRIKCYSKQEVLIEKMRSIIERTQPRDIYDLWYMLDVDNLDLEAYRTEFELKVKHKGLNPEDFMNKLEEKESKFKIMWEKYLSNQIHNLPDFNGVFRDLLKHLRKF